MNGGLSDIKTLCVDPEFLYIPLGNLLDGYALLVCLFYELIVDVGKVLNKIDLIASPLEITPQHVENAKGTGVSDVDIVVNRGAAGINLGLSLGYGDKLLFFPCQSVENFHKFLPLYNFISRASSSAVFFTIWSAPFSSSPFSANPKLTPTVFIPHFFPASMSKMRSPTMTELSLQAL